MTKKSFLTILALFFILALSLSIFSQINAQTTQTEYVLELQGPTWNHSIITVLVVPRYDEAWWSASYLNSTLRAISQWNEAISYFASNSSEFAYLSRLRMAPEVSNLTKTGFDAYIFWTEQFTNETCEAGLTRTVYISSNIVINSSITLAAHDCGGNVLSEVDMQNVAVHELGHVLGLGHANFTDDVMYFAYTLNSLVKALSTLDVYGVGTVFRWMADSQEFNRTNQGSPVYSVSLPSSIEYEYLPISQENLPSQSTIDQIRTFLDGFVKFILQPEIAILMLLVAVALLSYATIARMRRRHVVSRQPDAPIQKQRP